MKNEREELEQPDLPSRVYTSDTDKAVAAELRRGGDPYALARYFDLDIRTVLKAQRRVLIINDLLKKHKIKGIKDGDI